METPPKKPQTQILMPGCPLLPRYGPICGFWKISFGRVGARLGLRDVDLPDGVSVASPSGFGWSESADSYYGQNPRIVKILLHSMEPTSEASDFGNSTLCSRHLRIFQERGPGSLIFGLFGSRLRSFRRSHSKTVSTP